MVKGQFSPKWVKIKNVVSFSLKKIRTKIQITNTHNIQVKHTVLYFQV